MEYTPYSGLLTLSLSVKPGVPVPPNSHAPTLPLASMCANRKHQKRPPRHLSWSYELQQPTAYRQKGPFPSMAV